MFDFLFKRKKSAAAAPDGKTRMPLPVPTVVSPSVATLRQQALEQAAAVAGDEAAAVRFILACSVAEARLLAAQAIHDQRYLEQVYKATRETDRRVARLMQQRLAASAQHEKAAQRAQAVLAQAQSLIDAPALRANQVVTAVRDWQAIEAPPAAAAAAFVAAQARLEQRLQAQAALQRKVLDQIARLHAVLAESSVTHAVLAATAELAGDTLAAASQDAEMLSLPKQLLPELSRLHEQLQRSCKAREVAAASIAAREAALDTWEAQAAVAKLPAGDDGELAALSETAEPASTPIDFNATDADIAGGAPPSAASVIQSLPTITALQQAWRALPAVVDPEHMGALQQRFDDLLARLKPAPALAPIPAPKIRTPPIESSVSNTGADTEQQRQQRTAALEALQAALEEGALQRAMEHDRLLRSLDEKSGRLKASQQSALSAARAELGRLQGWARWGGTVSREELLAAVEALPAQQLAIAELAKKVGSMRERWRALDASAGPAPRALWLCFDAACTNAYAPVTEHFAVLSQERAANAQKAQALIDEVSAFAQGSGLSAAQEDTPDWRALAAFSQSLRSQWQRLGPIERREQKRLDAAFNHALQPLMSQLVARQQTALAEREALIVDVAALPPQARDTPERLQALQARWQQAAKAFPLTRQEEQGCWQRFRLACDAVFTERKNAGAAADVQRNAGLLQKEALCEALERSLNDAAMTAAQHAILIRDTRALWVAAGPVPRAAQPALQARFDAAVRAIEASRLAGQQAVARQQAEAVCARLALCEEGERLLLSGDTGAVGALEVCWLQLPVLTDELDAVLRRRFDALVAAAADDPAYVGVLQENVALRDAALLRLEIDLALESPTAFQRERLALQVAGLQSTFRTPSVGEQQSTRTRIARLCALPAVPDAIATQRITRVIGALHAAR
ncbi:MAG: DUF349 domain-containing protein [Herminiimonas sp.]|nr:DUF349 domain-containing protein [Herminiimonas sp.]